MLADSLQPSLESTHGSLFSLLCLLACVWSMSPRMIKIGRVLGRLINGAATVVNRAGQILTGSCTPALERTVHPSH